MSRPIRNDATYSLLLFIGLIKIVLERLTNNLKRTITQKKKKKKTTFVVLNIT